MGEYDLHIDIVGDDSSFSQTLRNVRDGMKKTRQVIEQTGMSVDQFFKKVRDNERMLESVSVKIDLSNPTGELKKFDEQVVLMCDNLDKYFEGLKGKLDAMAKALGDGSTIAGNIKTNDDNIAQIRELQRANAELTAEIQRQRAAYEEQQSQLRKMADAVRQNNIPAIQQMGEQMDEASKRIKTDEIRNSLKELSKESDEMARRMAKAVGDVEAYNSILDDLWKKIEAGDKSVSMKDIDEVEAKWGKAVKELEAAKKEYNELTDEQKKYVDELSNINGHHVRMRTQIMNVRDELMQMIAAGRQGTPEFQQLAEQAGQLRRQMTLASATMQYFADPNKNLTTLKVGLQGVAGAAGLVTGVMGLFNSENEKLAQIQAKVQSVLAVLVGLETTYNLVKKTSNVMLAIEEVKTFALAKARGVQTAATTAATVAQEGLNTAMRANPIGAIISLLAILGTAIYAIVKALTSETDAEKKAREEKEAHIKAIKEQHEQWAKSVAESASKQLISYRELQKKWDELGDDLKAKERFIKDNQDAFKNLGFAVDSVSDAERLLVTNTDAVVAAMMSRAKAAAYASQLQKAYEEQIERQYNKTVKNGGAYYKLEKNDKGQYGIGDISEKGNVTREEMNAVGAYTYGGLPVITEQQKNEIIANRRKAAKEIIAQLNKESNDRIKTIEGNMQKEIDAEKKTLQESGLKGYDENEKKAQENARKEAEKNAKETERQRQERIKAEKQFNKLLEQLKKERERAAKQMEFSTMQAEIDAMEDGSQKTIKKIELDFKKKKDEIERGYEDLKQKKIEAARKLWEANPANKDSIFDSSIVDTSYTEAEKENFEKLMEAITTVYVNSLNEQEEADKKAIREYLKQYGDYAQKKKAIYEEANEKICQLESELSDDMTEDARKSVEARIEIVKKGTEQQIDELDKQYGKAKQFMIDLFGDASKKSVSEIEKIIKKYEALSEFIQGNDKVTRETLVSLGFTESEINDTLDKLDKGTITIKDFSDGITNLKAELAERSPWQNFKKDIGDAVDLLKKSNGDSSKVGVAISNIGNACQTYLPEVERFATGLCNLFGIDDTGAKNAISAMKGLSVAAEGIGQIISGDTINGITNAVDGLSQSFNSVAQMIDDISSGRDMEAEYENIELKAIHKSVDLIVEKMSSGSIAQAIEEYEKAMERYNEELKKAQENLQDAFSKSSSDLRGRYNHHSINYYMNDFGGQAEFDQINALLGTNIQGWGDLWFLSPDQLAQIERELPRVFAIINKGIAEMSANASASSHDEEAQAALDAYMELAGKAKEIQEALDLKLTGTTAENVKSGFRSMLADMTSDAETFSENFEELIRNSVINAMMSNKYDEELEKWYSMFSAAYTNDKTLDEDEIEQLRKEYERITKEALEQRDALLGVMDVNDEKINEYFTDLRDMFLNTLTDMNADAESWSKNIASIMLKDIVSNVILGKAFEQWMANWQQQYSDALEAQAPPERASRLNLLMEELNQKREEWSAQVQELIKGLGWDDLLNDTDSSLKDLQKQYLDFFMDTESSAEDWSMKMRENILRSLIEKTIMDSAIGTQLAEWQAKVDEIMSRNISAAEMAYHIEQLMPELDALTEKGKMWVDAIKKGFNWGEEVQTPFSNMRDTFLSTLMDMEGDAADFRTKLDNIMLQDLMDKWILDASFTINGMTFDDFDTYLADWNKRYMDAVSSGNQEIIDALLEELVQARSITIDAAQELRERLRLNNAVKDTTFKDMADNWISTLMDMESTADDWAEEIGRTMARRIIEQMIAANMIQPLLDHLQEAFDEAMAEEGATWESAIAALSPEIEKLKDGFDELQPIVQQILNAFGIFKEDLDEIEEEVDTTFSSLTDSWISMLMDMEATADDWAKSVGRVMAQRIIEEMVAAKMLQPYLDALQSAFDGAIASGGTIDSVIAAVLPKINELKDQFGEIRPIVEAIMNAFGLIEEKVEEIEEEVGDTTFKGMASEWASALMDMEMTADDWAKNVGRIMAQKIIEGMLIPTLIQPLLDQMQVAFDAAMNMANATWQTAVAAMSPYLDQLKDVFNEVQPIAEQILNAFGIFREVKEEVVEEAKEGFSDLRGLFVSALMDMEADADKFGKDIARKMTEQMIDKLIEKQFGSQLDAINEAWYNALEAGDTAAMERIRQQLIELQKLCGEAVQPLLDTLAQIEYVPEVVEEEVDDTITSMRDDFLSALMDMRAGTKDFVTDIRTLLAQKLVEKFILNSQFDTWLNSIQQKYEAIMNSGKSEEEMAEAMQRLATEWGLQAKEMQEQTQHIFDITGLTDVLEQLNSPIADLRSTFRSALMDMTSDAQTFADNISQALTEAFIDRFVLGDEFDKRLEEWQEQYASIMRGNYTEEERAQLLNNLRQAITAAKEGYADEAKLIHELMGTTSYTDQKATMNMSDKATYDQFETYLGIAVAQQQATLQGNDVRQQILTVLQNMSGISTPKNDELESIRMLAVTRNEYLLDIKRTNRDILNHLDNHLGSIDSKLTGLI